uniref:CSON005442 protein n=1 Tax=Culicoides sonorensis TaxID=179676 RepID=A0A336MTD1_CULSO
MNLTCRICLRNNIQSKHYLKSLSKSLGISFSEIYKYVSGLEPLDEPDILCVTCADTLSTAYRFKKRLEINEKYFQTAKENTNKLELAPHKTEIIIFDKEILNNNLLKEEVEDKHCELIQDDIDVLSEQETEDLVEEVSPDKYIVTKQRIDCHSQNESNIANDTLIPKDTPKRNRKRVKLKNEIDKKEFENEKEDGHFDNGFACNECDKKFQSRQQLETHTCDKKTCPECLKEFTYFATLRAHVRRCHTEKSFCCHLCGTAFVRQTELQDHLLRHENPKPYECDICLERYAVKNSLKDHMRTCHIQTEEGFYCEYCSNSKKYPTEKKLLDHHARVHSGDDRYQCQQCPKRFKYPESLRNHHVRYHTSPLNWFSCNDCNFRGSTMKALEKHKLVHLDNSEKPFKCSYCDKGFGRRYEWNRHEMIHRSEKPFICGICGHMVRTNYLLQKHMRVHQQGRPYSCTLCDKTYRDRDTYKKHMKAHADKMEAKGEYLNLDAAMQQLEKVHKTIPIKAKSFPVILSSSTGERNDENLMITEVQEII